jgi:uncharacterized hydrophobic protein (TIGR00271 family)
METSPSEEPGGGPRLDLLRLFNLRRDQADAADIDAAVRDGVRVGGTNMWVLFFAILVASVGLNVNSTASIIGAMLISPLMGPIVGLGYGAGTSDFPLIRKALRNLAIFAALSLVTSTLYFAASPLKDAGSELLARTSPTIWDVLIAFFGGAAGVIALTRRSISNVVPGVAIATALMPPLCTAGFGLAHGRLDMFVGAFYLFLINGVFIATATLVIVRILKLPQRQALTGALRRRTRAGIALGLAAVLGPSVYLGWRLVQDEIFMHGARQVISALKADERYAVIDVLADPRGRVLRLTVLGDSSDPGLVATAQALAERQGLAGAKVEVRYPSMGPARPSVYASRQDEGRDDTSRVLAQLVLDRDTRIKSLEDRLSALEQERTETAIQQTRRTHK